MVNLKDICVNGKMQNPERDHLFPLCTSTDRNCTKRAAGSEKEILLMMSVSLEAEKIT